MKQVLLKTPPRNITTPRLVTADRYYGVQTTTTTTTTNSKGFVARKDFGCGEYRIHAINSLTEGNEWKSFSKPILSDTITAVLKSEAFEVYEFETPQELMAWLATVETN